MESRRPDASDSRIRPRAKRRLGLERCGTGRACGHWGELIQGRLGGDGALGLVTLPCPPLWAEARFKPSPDAPLVAAGPGGALAVRAARLALRRLGRSAIGGRLELRMAPPPLIGAGASTLAALTAIRAVGDAFSAGFAAQDEAALCLVAEGASDPLMHAAPARLLWAPREGRILMRLPPPPAMRVVGAVAGPGRRTDPLDLDFAALDDFLALYRAGAAAGRLDLVGRAATLSAEANQRVRPTPQWRALGELARECGAAGIAVAHTGSTVALLFAPGERDAQARAADALATLGLRRVWRFDPAEAQLSPKPSSGGVRLTK